MTYSSDLIVLFLVGSVGGFLNVISGGGSTLTLPILIFMGLDSTVANGTNRIGVLIQNLFAVTSFRKQNFHEFGFSFKLSLFTLPGAIIGALVSTRISDAWFQDILGVIMIGIVLTMLLPKMNKPFSEEDFKNNPHRWLIYPAMFVIGFYGGFIQVGVGFIFMTSLYHILRISLVYVNMHKVFIIFIYTIPSLIVFALTGNVKWGYGLVLAAAMALGAWFGAIASVKGGEKFIRYVLMVSILIIALKLLGVF